MQDRQKAFLHSTIRSDYLLDTDEDIFSAQTVIDRLLLVCLCQCYSENAAVLGKNICSSLLENENKKEREKMCVCRSVELKTLWSFCAFSLVACLSLSTF